MSLMDRVKKPGTPTPPAVAAEMAKLEAEEKAIKAGILPKDTPPPSKIAEPIPEGAPEAEALAKVKAGTLKNAGNGQVYDKEGADTGHILRPATPAEAKALGGCLSGSVALSIKAVADKKLACPCGVTLKIKPKEMPDGSYQALVPPHDPPPAIKVTVVDEDGTRSPVKPGSFEAQIDNMQTFVGAMKAPAPLSLFCDASEDGVATKRLETYAEALCAALCAEYHAKDVRMAPKDSPLAFGGWKGALSVFAQAQPPAPGAYAVSSGSEVGMVVFEALAAVAEEHGWRVVRGAGR